MTIRGSDLADGPVKMGWINDHFEWLKDHHEAMDARDRFIDWLQKYEAETGMQLLRQEGGLLVYSKTGNRLGSTRVGTSTGKVHESPWDVCRSTLNKITNAYDTVLEYRSLRDAATGSKDPSHDTNA